VLLNEPAVTVLKRVVLILSNIQLTYVLTKFIVLPNKFIVVVSECVVLVTGIFQLNYVC